MENDGKCKEIRANQIEVCAFIGARCTPTKNEFVRVLLADIANNACDPDSIPGFNTFRDDWRNDLKNAYELRSNAIYELDKAKDQLAINNTDEAAKKALLDARQTLDGLKEKAIVVAFMNSARFDADGLDNVSYTDDRLLLLDVDVDAKDADENQLAAIPNQFQNNPHIVAYWRSRRGEGWHGVFVTRCGTAHYDAAKRYILNKWPFADEHAINQKHVFFVFPGFVKQEGAIIYEATADEIEAHKTESWRNSPAPASSSPADSNEARDWQKAAYFDSYLAGLRSDCAKDLSHKKFLDVAFRCGCVLRECDYTNRINECAQIILAGCSGKGHKSPETMRTVLNQIQAGIDKGKQTVDWKHETPMTRPAPASSSPADSNASLALASEEQKLQPAINAMYSCRKPVLQKDGSTKLEFERGDIAPICAFLKARGVYKELFTLDNGLRTANGDELTSEVLTGEQLIMQAHGLPAMGVCAPRLCMQAARYVCEQNQKDSLRQFVDDLPVWDGVDRVSEFWQTYAGAIASEEKEREYLRSVARYMFTAIIGRALATRETPCKADMAIILEGNTGIGKTSLVKALCARKDWYKTLSLDLPEDEYKRALRMTQIVEIGEMGEPNNKQLQAIKRILSSELLSMRKKGVDDFFYFPVRAFTIATIDQTDVLNDGAGARRWLPVKANGVVRDEKDGHLYIDCDGIRRDLRQLYAQGKAIYDECGVVWNEINKEVQKAHTDSLTVTDERAPSIIYWMRTQKKQSAKLEEIAIDCLGMTREHFGMKEQKELGRALRLSGFIGKAMRYSGKIEKRWTHPDVENSNTYGNDEYFD